jgi:phosphate transport system permease protein
MLNSTLLLVLVAVTVVAYHLGRNRSVQVAAGAGGVHRLHSLPTYHGYYLALWCLLPALVVFGVWTAFESSLVTHLVVAGLPLELRALSPAEQGLLINDIRNLAAGNIASQQASPVIQAAVDHYVSLQHTSAAALAVVVLGLAMAGIAWAWRFISPLLRARNKVERVVEVLFVISSTVAIFTTIGIVLSVLFESIRFFEIVPITEFLFGTSWSPQMSIACRSGGLLRGLRGGAAVPRHPADLLHRHAGGRPHRADVGHLPVRVRLPSAARHRQTALEVLAGIPTVVYGFFAALTVAPFLRDLGASVGLSVASESALAAGLVMGIMIIPFVSSLSDDVINAVPQAMRDASYGVGATRSETVRRVIIPAALPGIVGAMLLAVSRAIGETMIVVMAAGLSANLTLNPWRASPP